MFDVLPPPASSVRRRRLSAPLRETTPGRSRTPLSVNFRPQPSATESGVEFGGWVRPRARPSSHRDHPRAENVCSPLSRDGRCAERVALSDPFLFFFIDHGPSSEVSDTPAPVEESGLR